MISDVIKFAYVLTRIRNGNSGHPCKAWKGAKHSPKSDLEEINVINQVLDIFICIKFDTECNETTPVIPFNRFHVDFDLLKKIIQNYKHVAHRNNPMPTRICSNSCWAAE